MRMFVARFASMLLVLWGVATVTFFIIRLAPGGPFDDDRSVRPEVLAELEAHYGLDQPLLTQYGQYLGNLLRGDLGPSFKYPGRTVNEIILEALPVSLELGLWALLIAMGVGIPLGIWAATRRGSWKDRLAMGVSALGVCLPTFVVGPVLILIFALWLGVVNSSGWGSAADRILPSITLAAAYVAYVARLMRSGLVEELKKNYVRSGRAKGVGEGTLVWKHAMRLAVSPVVAYLGPAMAGILTGSFVVESIFQVPGLGRFFVTASLNRDYTLVLGMVLFYAALISIFNFLADLAQAGLNPRVRHG